MYINPYQSYDAQSVTQRSSFHTHAGTGPGTCGAYDIDEVLSAYAELGYGALCLSNHNLFTDPAPYEKHGLCLLPGYEYTKDIHIACAGTDRVVTEKGHQAAIEAAAEDGGFAVLCHPNWKHEWYLPKEENSPSSRLCGYRNL